LGIRQQDRKIELEAWRPHLLHRESDLSAPCRQGATAQASAAFCLLKPLPIVVSVSGMVVVFWGAWSPWTKESGIARCQRASGKIG